MGEWTAKYIGLPYIENFDCGDLVVKIVKEQFGRDIEFPARRSPSLDDLTADLKEYKDEFTKVTEDPKDGDCVLMKSGIHWHIGVYFKRHGEGWVIHNSRRLQGTTVCRIRDLNRAALRLLGYYEWKE